MVKVLGIDEAGRGPVIGPMVMAGIMIEEGDEALLEGAKDSKLVLHKIRLQLDKKFKESEGVDYKVLVVEPEIIDAAVLSGELNLNWLEAHKQAEIINELQPDKAIIDCPSINCESYEKYLRALLDNLDDSYTGEWGSSKYVGRAEKFYRYNGFDRQITLGFKIAAFSKEELFPIYQKLNILVGATAPTYGKKGQFMRGTMTEITVGDYLVRQKGFMSNISLTWQSDYPWEINSDNLMVPHVLDVSITFTPIHDFNVSANLDASKGRAYMGSKKEVYQRKKVQQVNAMPDKPRIGTVEVGQGSFGGPFDNGDFVDIDNIDG